MNILVSGASGLIGTATVNLLTEQGHAVHRLVRRATANPEELAWSPGSKLPVIALARYDAVLHLAGKSVATIWTEAAKREILQSRVQGTETLAKAVAESFEKVGQPHTLVSASAIGYYGDRGSDLLTESSAAGTGFLADVCKQWEHSADTARQAGVRVVHPRIGIVLSTRGGALAKMLPPFRLGVAGRLGSGRQYWSWITLEDTARALAHLLVDSKLAGPVNLTAPTPATNTEFTKALGKALHRPTLLPLPRFVIRTLFGEMGVETMLSSQRAIPEKLLSDGFRYRHPQLPDALLALTTQHA